MEPATFLLQLFGVYFVLIGTIVIVQRKSVMRVIERLAYNSALVFVLAIIELVAGLAIVLTYPMPSATPSGIISLIGWMMVVESILYALMPMTFMRTLVRAFNTPVWYVSGGALAVLLGLYLSYYGFA
jgi:hypothetical protein